MSEPIEHHVVAGNQDPAANYSLISIAIHWLSAIAVIILFFTHEGDWIPFHIAIGVLLTVPLVARVVYRWSTGFPRPHDQHPSLNFLARAVMVSMMIMILVLMLTGLIMPLFEGTAYPFFGIVSWTAPYGGNPFIYEIVEKTHDIAGHAIIPLFLLHVVGFIKHRFIDKHGNKNRMLKPLEGGK